MEGNVFMAKYTWVKNLVPENLEIKQVYGIVFNEKQQIFLRIDDGKYKLTGGTPETCDRCIEDTLQREFLEEVNIKLKDIHYLGYQQVDEDKGKQPYAQVRMIALVDEIGEEIIDVCTGKKYGRCFVNLDKVTEKLHFDASGNQQIDDAIDLAKQKYNF